MSGSPSWLLFFLVFASVGGCLALTFVFGARFFDARQRRRIKGRLDAGRPATDTNAAETVTVRLLTDEPSVSRYSVLAVREWLAMQVESAGMQWTTARLLVICAFCAIPGCLFGIRLGRIFPSAVVVPVAAVGFALLPFMYLAHRRRKRIARFEEQLPEALDFLARSMRAGNALPLSLELLVEEAEEPLRSEFRRATHEIRLGSPMLASLQSLVRRMPLIDLRMFVSAVLLQRETGGNLSDLLNRIAATIRDRFRLRRQVEAAAAQGKLSARVLTALPLVVLGGILVLSPDYIKLMFDDNLGRKLLAAAGSRPGARVFRHEQNHPD